MEVGFSTGNQTWVACSGSATDANFLIANISEPRLITLSSVCLSNNLNWVKNQDTLIQHQNYFHK